MNLPVNKEAFQDFIIQSDLFGLTRGLLNECLKNWYHNNPREFIQDMGANLDTVINKYHFCDEEVSITKNFNFKPALDCITCTIRITDEADDCCMSYKAVFDYELNVIDDILSDE